MLKGCPKNSAPRTLWQILSESDMNDIRCHKGACTSHIHTYDVEVSRMGIILANSLAPKQLYIGFSSIISFNQI